MKYAIGGLVIFMLPLLLLLPILAAWSDPWQPFRVAGQVGQIPVGAPVAAQPIDPAVIPIVHAGVTDAFRYQLARVAGWSLAEALIATAISIAEDGSGDPAALSPRNFNGTYDFCLWQVNSSWWPRFGGQAALADPQMCANAGHTIYTLQGWCAWSTYDVACGVGHTGAYKAYLGRAQAASLVVLPSGQA